MSERLKVLLQHLLPKQRLTTFAGRVAGAQWGSTTTRLIRWFVGKYGVDMNELRMPTSAATRASTISSPGRSSRRAPAGRRRFRLPGDGAISQFGAIDDHHILQAKGHRFTTPSWSAATQALAARFRHGSFANLYLSPKDYHRPAHALRRQLTRMIYVPGALFSVNPDTARGVPNLFARNERVVCVFESPDRARS
jgi:phosphatidylserine decarboxylase